MRDEEGSSVKDFLDLKSYSALFSNQLMKKLMLINLLDILRI